ncbi:MAG: YncE family protein [Candidatus Binatia bacterium]|jgi:YVTN family beta-propeller protein
MAKLSRMVTMWTMLPCVFAAQALSAPLAYVNDVELDVLYVIDTSTHDWVDTIDVGLGPSRLALNPFGTRAYTSNGGDHDVSVIDTVKRAVTDTIENPFAAGLVVSPDGCELVVGEYGLGGPVSVIDTQTDQESYRIVPDTPAVRFFMDSPVISRDGGVVYFIQCLVTDSGSCNNSAVGIDLRTRKLTSRTSLGFGAFQLALDPNGHFLYATLQPSVAGGENTSADGIAVIDRTDGTLIHKIPAPAAEGIAVGRDGAVLYVVTESANLSMFSAANFEEIGSVQVADGANSAPVFVAVTPDGRFAYVTVLSVLQNYVAVVDTATKAMIKQIGLPPFRPLQIAIGPAESSTAVCVAFTPNLTPTPTPTATAALPTPTSNPTPSSCTGDCDGSGEVTVNEIIILVNIALGTADAPACPNGIPSGGSVDLALIMRAVNNALSGCAAGCEHPIKPYNYVDTRVPNGASR